MFDFVLRRIAGLALVLVGASLVTFLALHLAPGDPIRLLASPYASAQELEELRHELGLDKPLPVQFVQWLGRVVRGDLGQTIQGGADVGELIAERLPATVLLAVGALVIINLVAVPAGIYTAIRRDSPFAHVGNVLVLILVSAPTFWLGILLILLFASTLGWLPTSGYASLRDGLWPMLRHLILPAVTLAAYQLAWLMRTTRASVLDVMMLDYVRTARAKGLSERTVVLRHVLRNAWLPIITVIGLQVGYLLAGAVVVEEVFAWPGMGRLLVTEGIYRRDIPIVQAVALFIAVVFVATNFVVDLLYAALDPRVRYE
ncbi:MAG: hypothetical protein A2Z17_01950 [Gammaproteobacteria bacterium RBG_16_66_13]|nr:MAG: hypothetical protein A2Z17_01950 [Gammaproteobacteria bacterium RBG_16_66_13]